MKDRIVLLGAPATGKGTQAALLSATFGIPAASTGAILREEKRKGSAIGREAATYTDRGELFPDRVALEVVWSWLGARNRFILDGFPRTLGQALAFDEGLDSRSLPLHVVYYLDLPEEMIRERTLSRLTCPGCGSVFNQTFHKLSVGDACPSCGGTLSRRADDTPESLDHRLDQFRQMTMPVVDHYRQAGLLKSIDARPGRDAVYAELYNDMGGLQS
ncbi:MAG: adenylate kinase [Terrimicrobiaceae bacterium]